jgi:hypothetical protein
MGRVVSKLFQVFFTERGDARLLAKLSQPEANSLCE